MKDDKAMVERTLTAIHDMGFSVIRTWAFDDRPIDVYHTHPLQKADEPGKLNMDAVWKLRDLFDLLEKVNAKYPRDDPKHPPMKLMLTLTNHLKDYGGHYQYMRWPKCGNTADRAGLEDEFYGNDAAKKAYASYVGELIAYCRNGTTSKGMPYFDLIHSWDICNEPRNKSRDNPQEVTDWIKQAADAIKAADKTHPVTVGLEGFYGPMDPEHQNDDPYNGSEGVNWRAIGELGNIDFMSIHPWMDQWRTNVPQQIIEDTEKWIQTHMDVCRDHLEGKPLCIQEYGISVDPSNAWVNDHIVNKQCLATDQHRTELFEMVRKKMHDDSLLIGAMVWMIADGQYAENYDQDKHDTIDRSSGGHMIVPNRSKKPGKDNGVIDVLVEQCRDMAGRHKLDDLPPQS
eukprot:GHUV01004379.1.p1 GENE.GHUV01004379.1~~GHUV01004379.1.p1  ORF type:complete len:400 (+),score=92.26 GHUV01004379.1:776-1975(+)